MVSLVAKTCTNMSRLVADTSQQVNNHYNSNPDTFWKNLLHRTDPKQNIAERNGRKKAVLTQQRDTKSPELK